MVDADLPGRPTGQELPLRIVLEPAVLMDPQYRIDVEALARSRPITCVLLGALDTASLGRISSTSTRGFTRRWRQGRANDMIVDVVRRQNRLRRLAEYVGYTRLDRTRISMAEHVGIVDALLSGDVASASALLRRHLVVSREETETHFERDLDILRQSMARPSDSRLTGSPVTNSRKASRMSAPNAHDPVHVGPGGRRRGRGFDLPLPGIPGRSTPSPDVPGIAVGFTTVIEDNGPTIRTGVTAILPRAPDDLLSPVWAAASR